MRQSLPILSLVLLGLLFQYALVAQRIDPYVVTSEIMVEKPISPLLYSNFIELGYGIQVEPMWGEMLWNRSFEQFVPYKLINVLWYDLLNDPKDHSKGYKTDWRSEDWYHSGYEHNAWFAAPGEAGILPIDSQSTFFINETDRSSIVLSQKKGGIHGEQFLVADNEGEEFSAVAQEGKYLYAGNSYIFRGHFVSRKGPVELELRMYREGDWEHPLVIVPFKVESGGAFQVKELGFFNPAYTGLATFSIWIPGGAGVSMDALSLMPKNTIGGWRPEAIAAADYVKPGVIRFPGGCFASFYNWRDGIGPHDSRNPQPSYFWGGLNYNDVGVAELAQFCKAIGSEMMYCLNVFHPYKKEWDHRWDDGTGVKMGFEFPHFTEIEKGAREAADLVAYCNLQVGTHPMADLRLEHGYAEPFNIRFWEMDNEVHRWFAPEEYAEAVKIYSKAMKEVDPHIKIGLVTYGGRPGQKDYGTMTPKMLEICGECVDFLADRRDADKGLDKMLKILEDYERETGRYIAYCETEKLFMDGVINFNDNLVDGFDNKSYQFSKWFYAMNVLKSYLAYQRKGGHVWFVNFNNLANTHNQCVLNTPKEGAFVAAAGEALHLLSESPAAWPLVIEGFEPEEMKTEFLVQAAWNRDKSQLVLYVLNRTDEDRLAQIDFSQLGREFHTMKKTLLSAGSHAMNTMENPEAIHKTYEISYNHTVNSLIKVKAGSFSFTELILY